jgi:hypothetical protein
VAAIVSANPDQLFTLFRDRLNDLLSKTLVTSPKIAVISTGTLGRRQVAFRRPATGEPIYAKLTTRFGPMRFWVGQVCEAALAGAEYRIRTLRYKYTLTPDGATDRLFRWEYVQQRPPSAPSWCRHHFQGNVKFTIGKKQAHLNALHLPTGFVSLEEVLRFCIVDLEVPALSPNWDDVLTKSYNLFKSQFLSTPSP